MLSAESLGQNERRVALVEEEDLPVGHCRKFAAMRAERDALAAAGRADRFRCGRCRRRAG